MKRYNQWQINELADILKNDGVISVPTDTVFGLCAQISTQRAHDNLVKAKKRPHNKLFPIMCADLEQIKSIAIVNDVAKCIINKFMPGPITIILLARPSLPEYVNNGQKTIAVRMATSKPIAELIKKVGCPIFMSSANQSGNPTCTSLDEIEKACPTIDGMMEGSVSFGIGSTIVDCTSDTIKVLREGPISLNQILDALYQK